MKMQPIQCNNKILSISLETNHEVFNNINANLQATHADPYTL